MMRALSEHQKRSKDGLQGYLDEVSLNREREEDKRRREQEQVFRAASQSAAGVTARGGVATVARKVPKVGRNDVCPCGSGKKYKKCHGENEA